MECREAIVERSDRSIEDQRTCTSFDWDGLRVATRGPGRFKIIDCPESRNLMKRNEQQEDQTDVKLTEILHACEGMG